MKTSTKQKLIAVLCTVFLSANMFAGKLCLSDDFGNQFNIEYEKTDTRYYTIECQANLTAGGDWSGSGYYDAVAGKMNFIIYNSSPDGCTTLADMVVIRGNFYDMPTATLSAVFINRCYDLGDVGSGFMTLYKTEGFCDALRLAGSTNSPVGASNSGMAVENLQEGNGENILRMFEEPVLDIFNLHKNNSSIHYSVASAAHVELTIVNALGQNVKTLVSGKQETGNYNISWDGTANNNQQTTDGIYIAVLKINDEILSKQFAK